MKRTLDTATKKSEKSEKNLKNLQVEVKDLEAQLERNFPPALDVALALDA